MNNATGQKSQLLAKALGLIAVAAIASLAVSLVEQQTRERIAANQTAFELRAIAAVLPQDGYDNQPQQTIRQLHDSATGETLTAYLATRRGNVIAAAVQTVPVTGYVDRIDILIGIDTRGNLLATRVTGHRETPGLGDQIATAKSAWIDQLKLSNALANSNILQLKRDGGSVDHISGATITSRAVTSSVQQTLELLRRNQTELFKPLAQ